MVNRKSSRACSRMSALLTLLISIFFSVQAQSPSVVLQHANTVVNEQPATFSCTTTFTPSNAYSATGYDWWLTYGSSDIRVDLPSSNLTFNAAGRVSGSTTFIMESEYESGTIYCRINFSNGNKSSIYATIQPSTLAGVSCTLSSRCVLYSSCTDLVCTCQSGYTQTSSGICVAGSTVPYGGSCATTSNCRTSGATCSFSTITGSSTCACPSASNYSSAQDACVTAVPYGAQCSSSPCQTTGAQCLFSTTAGTSVCTCPSPSSYSSSQDTCLSGVSYGGQCVAAGNCRTANAACSFSTVTQTSICTCQSPASYVSSQDACLIVVPYGGQCTTSTSVCSTTSAQCTFSASLGYSVCTCPSTLIYNSVRDTCETGISYQFSCTSSDVCRTSQATCNGICTCPAGTTYNQGTDSCITSQIPYGGQCTSGASCLTANAECAFSTSAGINVCSCPSTRYYDSGTNVCRPLVLGSTCGSDTDCALLANAACQSLVCTCNSGYYSSSSTTCAPKIALSGTCSVAGSCAASFSSCVNSVCSCNSGYAALNGECVFQATGSCPDPSTYSGAQLTTTAPNSGRPSVRVGSLCYSVDRQATVTMTCSDVNTNPQVLAEVYWEKDGVRVSSGTETFINGNFLKPDLTVSNAQASYASTQYKCVMCYSSLASSCTTSPAVQLIVVGTDITSVVASASPSTTVNQGTTVNLTCQESPAGAADTYLWRKDGVQVSTSQIFAIQGSPKTAAGTYVCEVSNSLGSLTSSGVLLTVQYVPEHFYPGSTINIETTLADSGTETVTCDFSEAVPPIQTYAFYDSAGNLLQSGASNTLVVTATMGYQQYSCTASNSVGTSSTLFLNVIEAGTLNTGAATADTGLSTGALAAIILGVIFILLVIIIIVVCCCLYGFCKKKEKVEPTPEPKVQPKPYIPRTIVSAVSRKDVGITVQHSEPAETPRYSTPRYHLKPAYNGGPIISMYDDNSELPRAHQLPALDTQYLYSEEAPRKKKRRKKRHQRRHHEEESPRKSHYEEPDNGYAEVREAEDDDLVVIPGKQNYFE